MINNLTLNLYSLTSIHLFCVNDRDCAKTGDHECIKNGCLTIGSKTTCYCDTDYCNGSPQVIRKESLTLTSISVIIIILLGKIL